MRMNSTARITAPVEADAPPLLCNGDTMNQAEFHRRYEAYPDNTKFELVGGVVYMASPLRRPHGTDHPELGHAISQYEDGTPGVEASACLPRFWARRANRSRIWLSAS